MNHTGLLNFLSAAGHRIAEGAGAGWYDVSAGFFTAFPFDEPLDAELVRHGGFLPDSAIGARFACLDGQGCPAWTIRCEISGYDLDALSANTRSKVRRGLAAFDVAPVSPALLAKQGHRLNEDTLARQGRAYGMADRKYWTGYFSALAGADGAEIWGASLDGELCAYSIAFVIGQTSHLMILRSDARHLKDYVNNALVFGYLRHALAVRRLSRVSFGLEPLGRELPELVKFKESMGFRRAAISQAVVLRADIDRILRSPAGLLTGPAAKLLGRNEQLARLASLTKWIRHQDRLVFARGADGC